MDEIDAIGGRRFSEGTSADREIQRTLMELLNQLDGFDVLGEEYGLLAYTRYSFTLCVCKNQSSVYYPRPLALLPLLQYDCATFAPYMTSPRPSLYMPYTIQYW